MTKSLTDIAHDIAIVLLPKSMEEMNWTIWNDNGDDSFSYNTEDFVEEYVDLHRNILKELKIQYGENGDDYPR